MAYKSGQHGKLFIQNEALGLDSLIEIGRVRNWNINFAQDVLTTTCLSDTDTTIIPGVRSFTGSGTVLYYEETSTSVSSNITLLKQNMIKTRSNNNTTYTDSTVGQNAKSDYIKLDLRLEDGSDTEHIEVFAVMTSFNVTCSIGEVVSADFQFSGHGAPTQFDYK